MNTQAVVDATTVSALFAFFIPLVVSIVTKKQASDGVKATAAAVGAVVAAVLGLWLKPDHGAITWQLVGVTLINAIVVQLAAYKAIWQHGATDALGSLTANFGFGQKVVPGEVVDQ